MTEKTESVNQLVDAIERIRSNFPAELRALDRWLLWRYEQRGTRRAKTPYRTDGSRADVTDPADYLPFDTACTAYKDGGFDGIGFAFTTHDPYCGIDLDACVDAGGTISPLAMQAIEAVRTYSERSISSTGVHMIARATLPPCGRKSKAHRAEMYDEARFFVVTGNHIAGTPSEVQDRQNEIEILHARIFPPPSPTERNTSAPTPVNIDDAALLDRMFASKRGAAIRALWDGGGGDDASADDLSLCNALAFWAGRDPARIDKLFRQSGRMRDKWNMPARMGETYGEGTIKRACETTQKTFKVGAVKLTGLNGNPREGATAAPRYAVRNGRICEVKTIVNDRTGETEVRYTPLSNFNATITADVLRDDGEDVSRHLAISGALDDGRALPDILVATEDYDGMAWALTAWGGRAIIEPKQGAKSLLRHAIQVLSAADMEERRIYEYTGWARVGGQRTFLHAGGGIGITGVNVELPGRLADYRFPDDNAYATADAVRASISLLEIAPHHITLPLLALAYSAPLSSMVPPAFLTSVEGPSGARKSTLTSLFLNHFGTAFHEKHMPDDWMSTTNSLERMSYLAKDVFFVIDDFRPAESRREENEQSDKLGRIARAVGNRAARGRMTSTRRAARSYTPRGVVTMTAELGATGRSVVARQLTIAIAENDVNLQRLTMAQQNRHIYSYAMRDYIDWMIQNYDEVEASVKTNVITQRNEFATGGVHGRLPDAAAYLHVGFSLAITWFVSTGAIDQTRGNELCAEFKFVLRDMALQQNTTVARENPATKFMTTLVTLCAQKKIAIAPKQNSAAAATIGGAMGTQVGHWDDQIYLYPPAALREINQAIMQQGAHFTGDINTLGRDLHDAGWLARTGSGDRTQVALRVPGYDAQRPYFYVISKTKFNELATGMGFDLTQLYEMPRHDDDDDDE